MKNIFALTLWASSALMINRMKNNLTLTPWADDGLFALAGAEDGERGGAGEMMSLNEAKNGNASTDAGCGAEMRVRVRLDGNQVIREGGEERQ